MLSQTNEYALRVILHLADQPDRMQTTPQIAQATRVPVGYLSKVLQTLTRAGLITARRGLHGGFTLTRDPAAITLLDVVQAVDPVRRVRNCPLKIKGHGSRLCGLHRRIDEIFADVEASFRETSVARLLAEMGGVRPFCDEDGRAAESP